DAAANLSETQSVRVENIGRADLIISDVDVSNHTGPFRVEPVGELRLSPDSSADVLITFAPDTAGDFQDEVMIESNDPREPYVFIPLSGLGIAPVIDVTPSTHDFGTVVVGCTQTESLLIENVGTANLLVSEFSFSTASGELAVDFLEDTNGPLPWSISPNSSMPISITYRPLDTVTDQAFLTISTNDPYTPDVLVTQEGRSEFFGENEDIYTQEMGNTSFALSQLPVPQTIMVAIDGVTTTVGWSYNSALNAVEWNSAPEEGSSIRVQYAIMGECD
ncbi:MAG: choice-of-anchor D domain-containing protein, partial [Myxococcota bacterium]|nr:choice-of-anchor D domain-containing protein [Myxococcota bacterium]